MDDLIFDDGSRLRWWGSDCTLDGGCDGNTTPDSMRCENCGSDEYTIPLFTPIKL